MTLTELKGTVIDIEATDVEDEFLITATKVGAFAFTADGRKVRWTEKGLQSTVGTWEKGPISINHDGSDHGSIAQGWMDGEKLKQRLKVADKDLIGWVVRNKAQVGVSIEAKSADIDDNLDIVAAEGAGITFVFPPHKPACPLSEGCGLDATEPSPSGDETVATSHEEDHMSGNDDMVPKAELEAIKATVSEKDQELTALRAELADLKAFKEGVIEAERKAAYESLKNVIGEEDAKAFEKEPVCVLKKMVAAIEAAEKKKTNFPSGANVEGGEAPKVPEELKAFTDEERREFEEAKKLAEKAGIKF